jgi:hypothetical protein
MRSAMNRTIAIATSAIRGLLLAVPFAATLALAAPRDAQAQLAVFPPPPPAYVAVTPPEYYQGHPNYYYHNSWYYRNGGGWHYYRSEPGYLHDRRGHWDNRHEYRYHR